VNENGIRAWDRELDNNVVTITKNTRIVHTIGDSVTMGWGVNFESSYPAQLDFLLPQNVRVISVALNSFGTIAATEKSMQLWSKYPGILSIYLFHPNDYNDDKIATRHSQRPAFVHSLLGIWDFLRRTCYFANLPYAVYEWGYWKSLRKTGKADLIGHKAIYLDNPEHIRFSKNGLNPSDESKGVLSKKALLNYKNFLDSYAVPLWVLCLGEDEESKDFFSFCSEKGIETYLMTVPETVTLFRDGHLSQLGNFQLARFLLELMKSQGMLDNTQ
jgi:hypothetical protein